MHMGLRLEGTYELDVTFEAENEKEQEKMYVTICHLMEQMKLRIDVVTPGNRQSPHGR